MLCDANGRVGTVVSPCVSSHGCEDENFAGQQFHEFLCRTKLYSPSTFSHLHGSSPNFTFLHNSGSNSRIDYIGLPLCTFGCHVVSATIEEEDFQISVYDSISVSVGFECQIASSATELKFRRDWSRLRDKDLWSSFELPLTNLSSPKIFYDSTSLTHYFNCSVCSAFDSLPPPSRVHLKPFVSEDSLILIKEKKCIRQQFKDSRTTLGSDSYPAQLCAIEYKVVTKKLRGSLLREKLSFVHRHSSVALKAFNRGDMRSFWQLRKALVYKPSMPPRFMHNASGNRVDDYEGVRNVFRDFFSERLHGHNSSVELAVQSFRDRIVAQDSPLSGFPDFNDIDKIVNGVGKPSAAGIDDIQYLVFRLFKEQLTLFLTDLSLRFANGDLSFQSSVARLHELFKKGSPWDAANYRDIQLADTSGKIVKKGFRSLLVPCLNTYILDSMCGVFLHRGTDFCAHVLTTAPAIINARRWSAGVLFVDISCALASAIRAFITGGELSDMAVVTLFSRWGFGPHVLGPTVITLIIQVPSLKLVRPLA